MTAENRTGIAIHHVRDEARKLPDYPGYRIAIGGAPLLLLTFQAETVGLRWGARFDFSHLHEVATQQFPAVVSAGQQTLDAARREYPSRVSMTFRGDAEPIINLDRNDPEQLARYIKILENPDEITWARYDIFNRAVNPTIEHHIEIDNPSQVTDGEPGISVHIPKSQRWTKEVVGWVIQTSSLTPGISNPIDAAGLAQVLNKLSELGPFKNHPFLVDEPISQSQSK